jgi:hypothetical protein
MPQLRGIKLLCEEGGALERAASPFRGEHSTRLSYALIWAPDDEIVKGEWCGRRDSNPRYPAPKAGGLPLSYTHARPITKSPSGDYDSFTVVRVGG